MAMGVNEYLEYREKAKQAGEIYRKIPSLHEGQNQLQNLSDDIGRMVGELIANYACPSCGSSQTSNWTTCEGCGEQNDNAYEGIDSVGRVRASMRGCHIGPDD